MRFYSDLALGILIILYAIVAAAFIALVIVFAMGAVVRGAIAVFTLGTIAYTTIRTPE